MIIKILNNHFVTSFSLHSFVTMLSIGWTFSSRSVSFRMCPIRFLLNWKKKKVIDITMIIIMYNQRHHDHRYQLANVPYSLPLGVKEKKMTIKTPLTTTTKISSP